ncbi:sulfatase-like hydrolase/transferase [Paraburkholderia antibiotica]|uniref:Sulfatase-like hydrolase/transferase n=1 Tax=Paraburkholderia antibiotica TaxID=2728839 RepID=A0A7Y0A2P9_9BURK|nr:sulfatase-like hydrolase/transferase [Paraburkholderia antibiotica]NML35412.1 sulfatase-like hydrolase/transferase [Paraburkholderia antibiotica]
MAAKNLLFIMCDQLRRDHLGCYGHPYLRTRNIDALAARGVRFDNAFVSSGVCGPSRMSYYTGRTMSSHGATWNRVPLNIGEVTLGEYLARSGRRLALAGKTHVITDSQGIERMELAERNGALAARLRTGHFFELDRYDGHHEPGAESGYPAYLRAHGYDSAQPWTDFVISVEDDMRQIHSGWKMRNVHWPARVAEAHSETAYMTDQAIRHIEQQGDAPWALHLSYVKPHWPYVAPKPYHNLYSLDQCMPLQRTRDELIDQHPVLRAYRELEECANFARQEVSDRVRPVYQGLIQQLDDHLGRLFETLERLGRFDDTLIVFCADHGDFLGDHWLGEKEQFYDTVQRVPMIVYDPSPQADATRGSCEQRFMSNIDIVPTALDALGLPICEERIEGRSLLPLIRGEHVPDWREFVVSELDYSFRGARLMLGRQPQTCRAWMVRDTRWKYVHWLGYRPQLFDLLNDPDEYVDLGEDAQYEAIRQTMHRKLGDWAAGAKQRVTCTDEQVELSTANHKSKGVFFGEW